MTKLAHAIPQMTEKLPTLPVISIEQHCMIP